MESAVKVEAEIRALEAEIESIQGALVENRSRSNRSSRTFNEEELLDAEVSEALAGLAELEAELAASQEGLRRRISSTKRLKNGVAQLRVALALQTAEWLQSRQRSEALKEGPLAVLEGRSGPLSKFRLRWESEEAKKWAPLIAAERESARRRVADSVATAKTKVGEQMARQVAKSAAGLKKRLLVANSAFKEEERAASAAESRARDAGLALASYREHEEPLKVSDDVTSLRAESAALERTVEALWDALGEPDERRIDFLFALEAARPFSAVALERYRRETRRLVHSAEEAPDDDESSDTGTLPPPAPPPPPPPGYSLLQKHRARDAAREAYPEDDDDASEDSSEEEDEETLNHEESFE